MSPIKFEENLKEELEKRTIQTSKGAWDALANRLDPEPKKGRIIKFWWLGIAASLVLIVWLSKSYFSLPKEITPTIVVVPAVENTPLEILQDDVKIEEIVAVEPDLKIINTKEKESIIVPVKNKVSSKELPRKKEFVETVIAQEDLKNDEPIKDTSFEDQKVQEVVAQIVAIKEQNKTVTDAEIDALLKKAQKEIEFKKLMDENTHVVNADVLLYEVEAEINKSFRDKVFEELKIQFNSVKNAVAQRNN